VKKSRLLVLALAIPALAACVGPTPEQQQVTLQFTGGSIIPQAQKFKNCVNGGTRGDYDQGGNNYTYPADQRFVRFDGGEGADRPPIRVLSKDGVELDVPGQLQYYLNTDCTGPDNGKDSAIVQFHLNIGRRFGASFENGPNSVPDGWREAQKVYVETPLETSMDRAAQNYNWRDLVFNPQIKAKWEKDVFDALPELINRTTPTEVEFYNRFQPLIGVPTLVGEAGQQAQQAIVDGQRRVAEAQAREAEAAANKKAAEAQVAVAEAEARAAAARIKPYGGARGYTEQTIAEKGGNPYQPTIQYGGAPAPAAPPAQ